MAHTVASVGEANDYLLSNGASVLAAEPAVTVARKLLVLELVSRLLEARMERSDFGSGFGPRPARTATTARPELPAAQRRPALGHEHHDPAHDRGRATTVLVVDTDYYLLDVLDGYSAGPYRKVLLNGQGVSAFGSGFRVTEHRRILGATRTSRITSTTTVAFGPRERDAAVATVAPGRPPRSRPATRFLIGSGELHDRHVGHDRHGRPGGQRHDGRCPRECLGDRGLPL